MKLFLKRFFIFLVCYEVFFFFYPHSHDVVFNKVYEPLDVSVDTMDFSFNEEKKLGFDAYQKGNYYSAYTYLAKALEKEPDNRAIICALGICKIEEQEYEVASTFFLNYESKRKDDIKPWYLLLSYFQCLKHWPDGVGAGPYSYYIKPSLEYLPNRPGRFNKKAKLLNSYLKNKKWYQYLFDKLDENTIRAYTEYSIFNRHFYSGRGLPGFRSLKGSERNSDIMRMEARSDSLMNVMKKEYEAKLKMAKDTTSQ